MIDANEARKLTGPSPQDRVDALEPLIREAAAAKRCSIAVCGNFWAYHGKVGGYTADYKKAREILEGLGYKVLGQYSDDFTIVEW